MGPGGGGGRGGGGLLMSENVSCRSFEVGCVGALLTAIVMLVTLVVCRMLPGASVEC